MRKSISSIIFPSLENDLNHNYNWQIWVLKTLKGKANIKLLYSWITPSQKEDLGWQQEVIEFSDSLICEDGKNISVQIVRADFIGKGIIVKEYIAQLLQGKYFNEIEIGEDSHVPNNFLNLKLESDSIVARPEVLLPIEHLLIPWYSKSTPSPVDYSIFVSQLFLIDKTSLIDFQQYGLNSVQDKDILMKIGTSLKKATGFDITRTSAPRIGNIEWYRFPASDPDLESLISTSVIKDGTTSTGMRIHFKASPQARNILAGCRLINGEEIAVDEIKKLEWSNTLATVEFESIQPISEIRLTVWEMRDDNEKAVIVFETSHICMREMSLQMAITGSEINSGQINMLDKLANNAEKDKKKELAKFHRSTAASSSIIGGYGIDPWVSASRGIVGYMRTMFPEKSAGEFFLNGWDEEKGESGQLSFVEWVFALISGDKKGGLIFLDPFFDKDAIEIFAHARTTNTQYHILTCTQHREKEGDSLENSYLTQTAKTIQDACKEMYPLLRGLDFSITDLRSENKGKQQLFHDRYLLILDSGGGVIKGFHLSNSLQGATRKAPLLVTPIPDDILPKVFSYVQNLLDTDTADISTKKTKLVAIYPEPTDTSGEEGSEPPIDVSTGGPVGKLHDIPNAALLFSKLASQKISESANLEDVYKVLKTEGLIGTDSESILFYKISPQGLKVFVEFLSQASSEDFNKIMSGFGEMLARGHSYGEVTKGKEPYDAFHELINLLKAESIIGRKLESFLNSYLGADHLTDRSRIYGIFQGDTFEEILENALSRLHFMGGDFFGIEYKYQYAGKILVRAYPDLAVSVLDKLITEAQSGGWNEASEFLRAKMLLISSMSHRFLRYYSRDDINMLTMFLKSENFKIRAAASAALIQGLFFERRENYAIEDFNEILLRNLSDDEYRLSIAAFNAEAYLNRHKTEYVFWKQKSFEILTFGWIGDFQLLTRVTMLLSGRLQFNWSYSISINFLDVLVEAEKITVEWCFDFWNTAFLRKISFHERYENKGSESMVDQFSDITDIELTKSVIYYFKHLNFDKQMQTLNQWFETVKPMWAVINKPFAYHSTFNTFDEACQRTLWLHIIIKALIRDGLIKESCLEIVTSHLVEFEQEAGKVDKYQRKRYISPVMKLKEII